MEKHDQKRVMMVRISGFIVILMIYLFLELPSPSVSKWNGGSSGTSGGFSSFRSNSNDENNNPNGSGGFGSRGGGGGGFGGNYFKVDLYTSEITFSSQPEVEVVDLVAVAVVVEHLDQAVMEILEVSVVYLVEIV